MADTSDERAAGRRGPIIEIVIVIAGSAAAYLLELALAEHLPWGAEARGISAVFVGMLLALALTWRRDGTFVELGFRRPRRLWTAPIWAIGILVAFVAAQGIVPQLLAPYFDAPQPDLSRYDAIRGNLRAAIAMALILPLSAAIPEEIVYRGFLIGRLEQVFAGVPAAPALAVFVQSIIFGSIHFQWGLGGMIATSIMGVVWGAAYLLCGRNLWIVILAHSAAHVALVMQLYHSPVSP